MFQPIPHAAFARFHDSFTVDSWTLCHQCGGACELTRVANLLPGEASFIASFLQISEAAFRHQYVDGIRTPYGVVEVLRFGMCPFLNEQKQCAILPVKVVTCDIFPLVPVVREGAVRFDFDPWCPIVGGAPSVAQRFADKGEQPLAHLDIPVSWCHAIALYDDLDLDYSRLVATRGEHDGYVELDVVAVVACEAVGRPPPSLKS